MSETKHSEHIYYTVTNCITCWKSDQAELDRKVAKEKTGGETARRRSVMRVQWRTNSGYESVLVLDDDGTIQTAFSPATNEEALSTLQSLEGLDDWRGNEFPDPADNVSPDGYGDLVIERDEDGRVLSLDVERFKERLAFVGR